jgi:hypothetical protein
MKTYLINDDELFNYRIEANNFNQALALFKDLYRVQGRLRLIAHYSNVKEYKLDKSSYKFSIREMQ